MRDVLAVAGVIVVALGLGGVAAYMSVDLTPPGLDLIRPPKPAIAARIQREEKQRTIQAEAGECKYCSEVAALAKKFSLRADTARSHFVALKKALPQVSDETDRAASRLEELKVAESAATRAEAAAAVLTGWAARCKGEEFCKASPARVTAASCASAGDPRPAAALLIAMSVYKKAQSCASAACPAVDCQASGAVRSDIAQIEDALDAASGNIAVVPGTPPAQLAVGPSTLKAELTRITDEANYVTKLVPLLLDKKAGEVKLLKLAPVMVDERALSAAQLSMVMEQAASVADVKGDPRQEAAWRLKSLATNLAALGRDAQPQTNGSMSWEKIADSIGGSLLDLARLHAMLDRVSQQQAAGANCDTSMASATQQLREAAAMLDHCRMRAACVGGGRGAKTVQASTGSLDQAFARAKAGADALVVNELGQQSTVQVATGTEPAPIELLRSQGVCKRASDLREAAVVAPQATQAVADTAVASALTPATGALAPQDLISGAVQSALDAPGAPADTTTIAADALVQVAAPTPQSARVTPRRKPRQMTNDPALTPAAAPRRAAGPVADPAAPYQNGGVVIPSPAPGVAFGGEGGPQQLTPPPTTEHPPKE